jgi:hypothetical protein
MLKIKSSIVNHGTSFKKVKSAYSLLYYCVIADFDNANIMMREDDK